MKNPWQEFEYNSNDRQHVLKDDEEAIKALEEGIKKKWDHDKTQKEYDEYRLRLNLLPEPFVGHKDAPIYLLNLNPGYDEMNDIEMKVIKKYIIRNNKQENEKDDYPFYWLDPKLKSELKELEKNKKKGGKYKDGCEWWKEKLKWLVKAVKDKTGKDENECYKLVSKKIFCIEYFAYHSNRYDKALFKKIWKNNDDKIVVSSQKYNKYLIEEAIKKGKLFIIIRAREEFSTQIEKLEKYIGKGNVFFLNCPVGAYISEANIDNCKKNEGKNGWKKIIEKILEK